MHELMQFNPWGRFARLVDEHGADKRVRRLDSKSQLVALLHAQLSGAASLREIAATMASHRARLYHLGVTVPKRSTLADANAARPAGLFADLFSALLGQAHRGLRQASREAVRLIDATSLPLSSLSQDWASYVRQVLQIDHGVRSRSHPLGATVARSPHLASDGGGRCGLSRQGLGHFRLEHLLQHDTHDRLQEILVRRRP
jgi:hypothetical protein